MIFRVNIDIIVDSFSNFLKEGKSMPVPQGDDSDTWIKCDCLWEGKLAECMIFAPAAKHSNVGCPEPRCEAILGHIEVNDCKIEFTPRKKEAPQPA